MPRPSFMKSITIYEYIFTIYAIMRQQIRYFFLVFRRWKYFARWRDNQIDKQIDFRIQFFLILHSSKALFKLNQVNYFFYIAWVMMPVNDVSLMSWKNRKHTLIKFAYAESKVRKNISKLKTAFSNHKIIKRN